MVESLRDISSVAHKTGEKKIIDLTMSSFKMKLWDQKKQMMLLEVRLSAMSCASLNERQPVEWENKNDTY